MVMVILPGRRVLVGDALTWQPTGRGVVRPSNSLWSGSVPVSMAATVTVTQGASTADFNRMMADRTQALASPSSG